MDSLDAVRRAIDRIEEQITEPIRVSEIAQASGLSPWHFQRVFRAVVGETVGGYIRKRRLSKSIEALLETDRRILDIALEHGFESQEAYTRAFSALFELPPGRFRERGQRVTKLESPRIITERIEQLAHSRSLEARIIEYTGARYVGVQGRFVTALSDETDNAAVIPALWRRFREGSNRIVARIPGFDVGVIESTDSEDWDGTFFYTAAAQVEPDAAAPADWCTVETPPGLYAVFEHHRSQATLPHTITHALVSWLPNSEFQYRNAPELERYPQGFDGRAQNVQAEYWIPVRERGAE